jgi:hypothetical protein
MTTATLAHVTRPNDDALIGIDRALSQFEERLSAITDRDEAATADLLSCLRAAQSWLMTVNHEAHADDVANDALKP